jgi:hypothetical protein
MLSTVGATVCTPAVLSVEGGEGIESRVEVLGLLSASSTGDGSWSEIAYLVLGTGNTATLAAKRTGRLSKIERS